MKIKDIAKELHLSISTVSKALNGAFDISEETKEMVLKYAKEHGYVSRDQRLRITSMRRLCFLYDNVDASSQANIILPLSSFFSKCARQKNFEVLQCPITDIKKSYADFMKKNNFDGALIAGLNLKSPLLPELIETNIPTVLYDNNLEGEKISTVCNENINTFAKIVSYLCENGHTKIGFIHGDKNSFVSNERFAGYIIGLGINNIEYNKEYVYYGRFDEKSGVEAAKYFVETDVTAIVCVSDVISIGLIKGLQSLGKRIPEDISVTGYDDLDISNYITPSLTTVHQDLDKIANLSVGLLLSLMMNRTAQRIVVNGKIIIRNSTGPNVNKE
ncbi:MAG: LacI family transcriptional regulator [Anaeroplasma sp.]|nr:LacI family transcriptional regulator [Anaeroplasma sp.]